MTASTDERAAVTAVEAADPTVAGPTAAEPALRRQSSLRMSARAAVGTELSGGRDGAAVSRVTTLRSESPLILRPAVRREPEPWTGGPAEAARVCLSAGAAGPLGGDELQLDIRAGAGSTLVLSEVSATLLLPGADDARSRLTVRATVEAGATLVWWPQPVIAAHRCNHLTDVRIDLAHDARLLMREEVLLGRHGEPPGLLRLRLTVHRHGVPVHVQDLDLGSRSGRSPAVLGDHRALGTVLAVTPGPLLDATILLDRESLAMPLALPGALISAVGRDNLEVRRRLQAGLEVLGPQWNPS